MHNVNVEKMKKDPKKKKEQGLYQGENNKKRNKPKRIRNR